MYRREGQKLRRRNFPKGYAEMLEKQHNQLVRGLQELYQRLQRASLWEGEPLDESSGRPLAHDILAALDFLEPKGNGGDESEEFQDFVDHPQLDPMLDEASEAIEIASADSTGEARRSFARPDKAPVSELPAHSMTSGSPSDALQIASPDQSPEPLDVQQHLEHLFPDPAPLPIVLPHEHTGALWDDPLYSFDAPSRSSQDSSLDGTNWNFQIQAMPPAITQIPGLHRGDSRSNKIDSAGPPPSLSENWLRSGIGFDKSDFISELYRLKPQQAATASARRSTWAGTYT